MNEIKDQTGRLVTIYYAPKKIVSLVPSQTELLFHLGLEEEVIGITRFCVHPKRWLKTKANVGGTKAVDVPAVQSLHPDLIIANKEENVKEQIEALENIAPVYISDVQTYEDALAMIETIGLIVGRKSQAAKLSAQIRENFQELISRRQTLNHKPRAAYLIWREPYMTVGGDTFINDMMKKCGFINVFENEKRYPQISLRQLLADDCQLVLLSSEPYPFREKHLYEIKKEVPDAQVMLADGEMFGWYGSRLLLAPAYFSELMRKTGKVE
ncbi:MAG: ABC transporter substrate-binding protein [Pyrinomonadaceae bacterium]